jgi:hypothetical protein
MQTTTCSTHGAQGIGLVCTHVAHALLSGAKVGFFWGDETDNARPDAWCKQCELALRKAGPEHGEHGGEWFTAGEFKVLCAACWDEANAVCGGRRWSDAARDV